MPPAARVPSVAAVEPLVERSINVSELSPTRLALVAVAAVNVALSLLALVVEGPVPSAIVFPIVIAVGIWRLLRAPGRGGLYFLVAGVVFLLIHVPFLRAAASTPCVHPVDAARSCHAPFWLVWLALGPIALIATAALSWARERRRAAA